MNRSKKTGLLLVLALAPLFAVAAEAVPAPATAAYAAKAAPRDIIGEIIDVVGLKPRFEVRTANIDNAAAVIYRVERKTPIPLG